MAALTLFGKQYENAQEAFEELFSKIKRCGEDTNVGTRAIYNVGFTIRHPRDRMIKTEWRKWSKPYAEREWKWYLSQDRSVEELKKYAPMWDKMHGGDNIVNSNYGWQWNRNGQLQHIIDMLKSNPNTRQACITLYDGKEHEDYKYDTPCTLNLVFRVHKDGYKNNVLDMSVLMRSNDLVYGFCNDQYCFSKLQEYIAHELGVKMGKYFHYATDLHIYNHQLNLDKS